MTTSISSLLLNCSLVGKEKQWTEWEIYGQTCSMVIEDVQQGSEPFASEKRKALRAGRLSGLDEVGTFQDIVFYGDFGDSPDTPTPVGFELAGIEQLVEIVVPDSQGGTGFLRGQKIIIFSEHKGPPFLHDY